MCVCLHECVCIRVPGRFDLKFQMSVVEIFLTLFLSTSPLNGRWLAALLT